MSAAAENNKAAAEILSQMLDKGEIMQNPDGSVEIIKEDESSHQTNMGGEMIWLIIDLIYSSIKALIHYI